MAGILIVVQSGADISQPEIYSVYSTKAATAPVDENDGINPDETVEDALVVAPIDGFSDRITKKPYGIFITPDTSPVQPEKFVGYHTGVDAEYEDVDGDIPVYAVSHGVVERSGIATGYGGYLVVLHKIGEDNTRVIYGHLDPQSLPAVDLEVEAGDQIGILGEGGTSETDGERKHLHLGMLKPGNESLAGYVGDEGDLQEWYDPMSFFE